MQISRATEYALLGLIHLAREKDKTASAREISEAEKLSPYFLRNIFQKLRDAGLVSSSRGSGYSLTKTPRLISLKMVIEAVEGEVNLHECLKKKDSQCQHSENCKIIVKWEILQRKFLAELHKVRLSELI